MVGKIMGTITPRKNLVRGNILGWGRDFEGQ